MLVGVWIGLNLVRYTDVTFNLNHLFCSKMTFHSTAASLPFVSINHIFVNINAYQLYQNLEKGRGPTNTVFPQINSAETILF